ncbi:MAG: hypothetical protein KIS73_26975 [Enhydrobacter sp.]|nr:hypothetical protein [Enhydrobacter sp.]
MAASDILGIWNDAIGNIGVKTSIASLTEQSAEAAACALRYQGVVEAVLRQTDWNCCRMTLELTDVTEDFAPPVRWSYRYSYPTNCLRIWRMENPAGFLWRVPDPINGFEVAMDLDPDNSNLPTRYIYSNYGDLSATVTRYAYHPENGYYEALFDASLKEALGWALAAAIAGALSTSGQLIVAARNEAARSLADAMAANANESAPNSMDVPMAESLAVRGYGDWWPYSRWGGR